MQKKSSLLPPHHPTIHLLPSPLKHRQMLHRYIPNTGNPHLHRHHRTPHHPTQPPTPDHPTSPHTHPRHIKIRTLIEKSATSDTTRNPCANPPNKQSSADSPPTSPLPYAVQTSATAAHPPPHPTLPCTTVTSFAQAATDNAACIRPLSRPRQLSSQTPAPTLPPYLRLIHL